MFVGLDLSLSDSGVVILEVNGDCKILKSSTSDRVDDTIRGRFSRYKKITDSIYSVLSEHVHLIDCIAIESQSYGSSGRIVQIAESAGIIKNMLVDILKPECLIIEVAPMQLKKYILGTGKGKKDKNLILKEIYKKYNEDIDNDNIADAFVLSQISRDYFNDSSTCRFQYQVEVIKALQKKQKEMTGEIAKPKKRTKRR